MVRYSLKNISKYIVLRIFAMEVFSCSGPIKRKRKRDNWLDIRKSALNWVNTPHALKLSYTVKHLVPSTNFAPRLR